MQLVHPSRLLRIALAVDAVGSGAFAALQLAATAPLSERLALPAPLIAQTGIFFVAYVALLVAMARSARLPVALVLLVAVGNLGWAAGCVALAFGPWLAPTALGVAFLLAQAVGVIVFALLQIGGLRSSAPADRLATAGR